MGMSVNPKEPAVIVPNPIVVNPTTVLQVPADWLVLPLGELCSFTNGVNAPREAYGTGVPFINVLEVITHTHIHESEIPGKVRLPRTVVESFLVRHGDVLFNRTSETRSEVGLSSVYIGDGVVVFGGFVIRGQFVDDHLEPLYVGYGFRTPMVRAQIILQGQGAIRANIGQANLKRVLVPIPPKQEQHAIAEALSDADGFIQALDELIVKKRAIRRGAMQRLLTGETRLPGFSGIWKEKKIGEIATVCSEKNSFAHELPVLTCSKHVGFIDSLDYFKSQVFSKNLSGYKIIKRGQIGYPANHIEEGSIGLQDLYDVALVSPIYVVFAPNQGVSSYFLHRLLKLDSYRQEFATATTSSIDRRGSLRWPAFSEIVVRLPPIKEQRAIVGVLSDMDAEIVALERRLHKTNDIKQGMLQQLLTGRTRLVKASADLSLPNVASTKESTHSWAFNEAVVISMLSKQFGTEQFPLGRKRYTKLSYLLHRHAERQAEGYLKKAAGPYNPRTKYGGPERIAVENGYIREHKSGPYRGFIAAENVAQAVVYFEKWYGIDCVKWLEQFRFMKNDDLELLATVDMAAEDLRLAGKRVDVDNVKNVISDNPEWQAKLARAAFSNVGIRNAIETIRRLFG